LIWATTTPVNTDAAVGASNSQIDKRNALALELMRKQGIVIDDQLALMAAHYDLHNSYVHYTAAGYDL
jgi:hypothetical protein